MTRPGSGIAPQSRWCRGWCDSSTGDVRGRDPAASRATGAHVELVVFPPRAWFAPSPMRKSIGGGRRASGPSQCPRGQSAPGTPFDRQAHFAHRQRTAPPVRGHPTSAQGQCGEACPIGGVAAPTHGLRARWAYVQGTPAWRSPKFTASGRQMTRPESGTAPRSRWCRGWWTMQDLNLRPPACAVQNPAR